MKFKVKKTLPDYTKVKIEDWLTINFIQYFKAKHKEVLKINTHKPEGMILTHINSKNIALLYKYGRIDFSEINPNVLYKEFIDWIFEYKRTKADKLIRLWFLSKQDIMTDFLDWKASQSVEIMLGTDEEFERAEAERLKKAKEFYRQQKIKELENVQKENQVKNRKGVSN